MTTVKACTPHIRDLGFSPMNRRDFLTQAAATIAVSTIPNKIAAAINPALRGTAPMSQPIAATPSPSQDLDFASALHAVEAIRKKQISSLELTERMFARIDRYNSQLNAYVYQLREDAAAQAKKADEAQASGKSLGVLHGVPFSIKESFGVAGHPDTWGIPAFKDTKAPADAEVVARLRNAGAILLGATNVPIGLGDWQSYNSIYGTTNNPWDLKRTPGGSSGGTAASLAAGLAYLSVGSDIGGSIRVPSHFCSLFGHKPTLDLVCTQGQLPGGMRDNPGFDTLLAVAGPMARSAADLMAALKILGGPVGYDAKSWKWELPAPRAASLKNFRVGYVIDDPIAPPTPEMKTLLEKTIAILDRVGAQLKPGWPAGLNIQALVDCYKFHLFAFLYSVAPPEQQESQRKANANLPNAETLPGMVPFAAWQRQNLNRLAFRARWQDYFNDVDIFLSPVAYTPAFPHDHSLPQDKRTITTSAGSRDYMDMLNWIAPATLTGCPATAAPIGLTPDGLPVGIQIMGPYWEDATPIQFAELLAQEIGGFKPPPGYDA
jgi:amidase